MRLNLLLVGISSIILSSCGSGSGDGSSAADGGSKVLAGPMKREAGNWKTEMKLVSFDMPGMPAGAKDQMAKGMANAVIPDVCLTKEQAEKEDIANEMSKGQTGGGECNFSKKDIGGGKLDIAGTCKGPTGQAMNIAMSGTMAPKKVDMTMKMSGAAPTGTGNMSMEMQMIGTNTGPCKA